MPRNNTGIAQVPPRLEQTTCAGDTFSSAGE
ncbi:hypothetical protein CLV63_103181 [Murinocardiopsis flavida]|uniref:Uncharacterized protein n=1 Tax=Murinocardiopsis flavida TaxID=645275 RepID=A0A2P8DQG3_9ACTN|nr:hypothetical protein CLV63_103181 [Murinocardiopsis flavida]